jgi:acetyl esterase
VTLLHRETTRPPLAAQLLMYPAVDLTLSEPSVEENATGYGLTADNMRWYAAQYAADPDGRRDPLASPLLADDVSHTPPAVVVTAAFDVLRDQGDRYADRLRVAGVPVQHRSYPTLAHSFMGAASTVPAAREATEETLALFRAVLHAEA